MIGAIGFALESIIRTLAWVAGVPEECHDALWDEVRLLNTDDTAGLIEAIVRHGGHPLVHEVVA